MRPGGLSDPQGSCPCPRSWSRTHGAHLHLVGTARDRRSHGFRGSASPLSRRWPICAKSGAVTETILEQKRVLRARIQAWRAALAPDRLAEAGRAVAELG